MKNVNKREGITLIALVVTIIVLLILSGVTISMLTGQNGILTRTTKANFYTEMSAIEENKNAQKSIKVLEEYTGKSSESEFIEKQLSKKEIEKFSNTLKAEILYARNNYANGEPISTKRIWKNNMLECQDTWKDEEFLKGLENDIYYIKKEAAGGKEEEYIYDQVTDKCYKIKPTGIGKETVHSLQYAKLMLDGVNAKGIGTAEDESKEFKSSDGTIAYEPDLNNLSYKTEVIYYSEDFKNQYKVSIKQYIEEGKKKQITVEGKTYTFVDYKETGTKIWGNIECTANGLESYWVWIPRYAYKLDASVAKKEKASIIFVDINDKPLDKEKYGESLPEGYEVHAAFKQKEGLKGIWFSKYEPSSKETVKVDQTEPETPDLKNFKAEDTKLIYYTQDGKNSIEVEYSENPEQKIKQGGKEYYFYNYESKIWANVKCTANGLESYWVWIPRYAYKIESGQSTIILIDENDKPIDKEKYGESLPEGFTVHAAFKQKEGLKGIWFSKYEPSSKETTPLDQTEPKTPNLKNFKAEDTKLIYYTQDGKNSIEVEYSENPEQKINQDGKEYYFYNYENKIWANVKCMANGLESYWVWIPRYAYKIESGQASVIFVDKDDKPLDTQKYGESLPEGYKLHSAFKQKDGLEGIWFSKYEPTEEVN